MDNNELSGLLILAGECMKKAKDSADYKNALAFYLSEKFEFILGDIAKIMNCDVSTVAKYKRNFEIQSGEDPAKEKLNGNNSYLTIEEEKAFLANFFDRAKSGQIVVISEIQREFEKTVGRKVHHSMIYRLLDRHGWRKVAPRKRHPKANKEVQEEFKKNFLKPCSK